MRNRTFPLLTALLLAALVIGPPSTASAQTPAKTEARKRATPPGPGPAKEVRFPAFQEKTLANGLRIVVIEEHKDPLVSLRLVVKGGRAYEPEGKAGLAEASALLLTKGTAKRSAQQAPVRCTPGTADSARWRSSSRTATSLMLSVAVPRQMPSGATRTKKRADG